MPADVLPGWSRYRRVHMSSTGTGGIDTLGRVEVSRVTDSSDGANGRAPQVALLRTVEGGFQTLYQIATQCVSVPLRHEELYVQRESRYLAGTADILTHPTSIASMDIKSLQRDSCGATDAALRNIFWYSKLMLSGRLIVHQDYESLLSDRFAAFANLHDPKHPLETLLRVPLSRLPAVPPFMLNNPLPHNLTVPEPMSLRLFPEFVKDLPIL